MAEMANDWIRDIVAIALSPAIGLKSAIDVTVKPCLQKKGNTPNTLCPSCFQEGDEGHGVSKHTHTHRFLVRPVLY